MLLTTVCNLSFSWRELSAQIQERSSSPGTSCHVWKSTLVEQNLVSLILTLKPKLGLSLCHACRNSSHDRIVWLQKISIPTPPPHGRSLEIPRGRGGSKAVISEGYGGFMGNYFPRGDRPCTKHWKQRTIDLKHKNIPTYVVLKHKSVIMAAEMRLTSLALMFLFFFELASTTISRRTAIMCLWNKVKTI